MAALTSSTPVIRRILGPGGLAIHSGTFTGTNGDTWTLNGVSQVENVIATPTTAISVGITTAAAASGGITVTFVTGGAFTAKVSLITRTG